MGGAFDHTGLRGTLGVMRPELKNHGSASL
jgi:hypothetical protein